MDALTTIRITTNLNRLVDRLVSHPCEIGNKAPYAAVCMNPERACEDCCFNTGHLAKWCSPLERAAKLALDQERIELEAA